jgi:DNA-binding transcriptional MocR family regulator
LGSETVMSFDAHRGRLAARAASARTSPIDEAYRLIHERPDVVSFAAGAPDASLLSAPLVATLSERALRRFGAAALQYGLTQGFAPLRTAALPLLTGRSVACTPADIHVSTGGSGALNNLCMVLLDKDDIVLVERPTYSPAIKTMLAYEATPVAVECDDEGMVRLTASLRSASRTSASRPSRPARRTVMRGSPCMAHDQSNGRNECQNSGTTAAASSTTRPRCLQRFD